MIQTYPAIKHSRDLIEAIKPAKPYICKCGKALKTEQTAYLNADREMFCKECLPEAGHSSFRPIFPVYLEQRADETNADNTDAVICELKPCFTRDLYNIMPDGVYVLGYTEDFTNVYVKTSIIHDNDLNDTRKSDDSYIPPSAYTYGENRGYLKNVLDRNNLGSIILFKSLNDVTLFFCDSILPKIHINALLAMHILDIIYSGRKWTRNIYTVNDADEYSIIFGFTSSPDSNKILSFAVSIQSHSKVKYFPFTQLVFSPSNMYLQESFREKLNSISSKTMLDYFNERLIGQEEAVKKIVYQFYEYFLSLAGLKTFSAPAWLITAPSGYGKTEIYHILKSFCHKYELPVPIVNIDLTMFTETGFKGKNTEDIAEIVQKQYKKCDGTAIVFLDEADKKCEPRTAYGGENVNKSFQHDILTIIEGTLLHTEEGIYDTNKTMFVMLGSFQTIRDKRKAKKDWTATAGFSANIDKKTSIQTSDDEFHGEISLEDIIELGMTEELAGRLQQIVALKKLSGEDILRVIRKKTCIISEEYSVEIEIAEQAVSELIETAYTTLGIRKLIYTIKLLVEDALLEQYYESDFDRDKYKVVIKGIDCAELVAKQNVPKKASKKKRTEYFEF